MPKKFRNCRMRSLAFGTLLSVACLATPPSLNATGIPVVDAMAIAQDKVNQVERITIVIVAVYLAFAGAAFDRFIAGADISADGQNSPAFAALQILGLTCLLSYLLVQVGGLASGLAGGVSTAAMTLRQMASPITSTARAASSGVSSAHNIVNPLSTRLDPKTGLQTTSRRLEHMAMGRSVVAPNPAYRRAVMDQLRNSWGTKNSVSDKS